MSASVEFISPAEHALAIEERLVELVDILVELGNRVDTLEAMAVENFAAGGNPLSVILAKLDALGNRLDRMELHQRRPMPLTVIENHRLDPDEREVFLELQRLFNKLDRDLEKRAGVLTQELSEERRGRRRGDSDLVKQVAAFNARLTQCGTEFTKLRTRVANIEAKQGA